MNVTAGQSGTKHGDERVSWTKGYSRELSSCLLCHSGGDTATFSSMLPVLL